jgi:predicted nucleotide-binding protein
MMDKSKALELLKEAINEIQQFKMLHWDNQEFKLWIDRILDILEVSFGSDSTEYQRFAEAHPTRPRTSSADRSAEKRWYLDEVKMRETALKSIIEKCQILGIEGEGDKGGKVGKMDNKRAIEFLKDEYIKISQLMMLPPNNQEYPVWRDVIIGVLREVFGEDSYEYDMFVNKTKKFGFIGSELTEYRDALKRYDNAILSIIRKNETLGGETMPTLGSDIPKAFIAYGGRSGALDKLCDFLNSLGIQPLVVERLPSMGMLVDEKVGKYQQEADCAIILATGGGIIDEKTRKQHPRLNVIDELARLRKIFPTRTILLLEHGVQLPSNVSGIAYEHFTRQSMDRAFTAIARELTEFGILKAVKPQNGASSSSGDVAPVARLI